MFSSTRELSSGTVCETSKGAQSPRQRPCGSLATLRKNLTSSAFLLLLRSRSHGVDPHVSARAYHMSRALASLLAGAEAGGGACLWPVEWLPSRGGAGAFSMAAPTQCRRPRQHSRACVLEGCCVGTPDRWAWHLAAVKTPHLLLLKSFLCAIGPRLLIFC